MKAIKVTDNIYWVGAIDWDIRDFHGYSTDKGTTYNAFLITGKTTVLIDTVKEHFYDEMMARIKSVIDPKTIDIIVSNHSEMDHTGCLLKTIKEVQPKHIYASAMGVKNIKGHFGPDVPVEAVANTSVIDLGDDSLKFIESRMLHWPDSMVSYLEKAKVLFCNDIFGMHYASTERFDDELSEADWLYQAKKYYANIILPYSQVVKGFLAQLAKQEVKPVIICPDHGPIWRGNPARIQELYVEFCEQHSNKKKAIVLYDTMWGSTEKMAASITDGLACKGIEVKQMSMHCVHRSDVMTELLDSAALVLGSPVLNQEIFPAMADVTTYMRGLRKPGLIGASFGSYGWSDATLKKLDEILLSMQVQIVAPAVQSFFVPDEAKLKECFDLGAAVGDKILERIK